MMQKFKISFYVLLLYLISSCSFFNRESKNIESKEVKDQSVKIEKKVSLKDTIYQKGVELFKENKYSEAISLFKNFQTQYPADRKTQLSKYYLAESYAAEKKWLEAISQYRNIIGNDSSGEKLRAESLYRLSYAYEATGEDVKVVTSLLDALLLKPFLEKKIASAEAPARLAAAYARIGNLKVAEIKYKEAEAGLFALRRSFRGKKLPEWFAATLYNMGSVFTEFSTRKELTGNFSLLMKPLEKGQLFLLHAIEESSGEVSRKSVEKIKNTYKKLWNFILNFQIENNGDIQLALKRQEDTQWNMAEHVLQLIEDLKHNRITSLAKISNKRTSDEESVFVFLNKYEVKLKNFLTNKSVDRSLTPEAQKREGLKREGRIQ